MASTHRCEYCGSTLRSDEKSCPNCGAANPNYVADTPRTVFLPKTIEELKEYCAERGMPLLRMRFFIGEDYREPRAFGIYRDGKNVVVYKNKADGTRAVRYRGPNEEHAVNELFQKLLEECHNRGIYPDGKTPERAADLKKRKTKKRLGNVITWIFIAFYLVVSAFGLLASCQDHEDDGYYGCGDGKIYYRYGTDWYYTYDDNAAGYWYETDSFAFSEYEDYYLGTDFDSDWGVSSFTESRTWESIRESHSSSSSDYDSWDSSDTNWDSDW